MFCWCFLGVLRCFLALFNIWAENRIFEPRTRFSEHFSNPLNMYRWCFLNVSWYFKHCLTSELRIGFLSQEPCFYKFREMTQNMFNQHAINCRALLVDKLVKNPGLSYVRLTTSYIKYRRENHMILTHHMTHSKCRLPPGQWWLATTLRWAMSLYFKFR